MDTAAPYKIIHPKGRDLELRSGPDVVSSICFSDRTSIRAEGSIGGERVLFEPANTWQRTITCMIEGTPLGTVQRTLEGHMSTDLMIDGVERRILLVHTSIWRGLDMALTFEDVPIITFHLRPKWFRWPNYDVRIPYAESPIRPSPLLLTIGSFMITVERLLRGRAVVF